MLSYIEKLRKVPLNERRQVAAVITVVVVGVIALIWFGSLVFRFSEPFERDVPVNTQETSDIIPPY